MGRLLLVLGAALLTGCASCNQDTKPNRPGPARGTVRVRAITDAEPVRLMVPAGTYLFSAGSHGLDRWDPLTDRVLSLSQDHGLPGDRVLAIAPDVERMWLWIATDGGLGYYDVAAETFAEIPPSKVLDVAAGGDLHLAPATDGGVWIGHSRGLFYANPAGQWTATPIDGPINALSLGEDGWLWIGTQGGLVGRQPNGESFKYGAPEGCDVSKVRLIARAPGGGVLVIGENASGKQRLAVRRGQEKAAAWVVVQGVARRDDRLDRGDRRRRGRQGRPPPLPARRGRREQAEDPDPRRRAAPAGRRRGGARRRDDLADHRAPARGAAQRDDRDRGDRERRVRRHPRRRDRPLARRRAAAGRVAAQEGAPRRRDPP